MRALLMLEQIYKVLHADASAWYVKQAELEPARWVEWTAEALCHDFVLGDSKAEERWRNALTDSRAAEPAPKRVLLEVVTGFVESIENGPEVRIDPAVAGAISALAGWALFEHAASVADIRYGPCELQGQPAAIRSELALAHKFYPSDEWPAALYNLIEMAIASNARMYERVLGIAMQYDSADVFGGPAKYCYTLLMARAWAGSKAESPEAEFEAAYQMVKQSSSDYPAYNVLVEMAGALAKMGELDRGIETYQRALSEAERIDPKLLSEERIRMAELLCVAGARRRRP